MDLKWLDYCTYIDQLTIWPNLKFIWRLQKLEKKLCLPVMNKQERNDKELSMCILCFIPQ